MPRTRKLRFWPDLAWRGPPIDLVKYNQLRGLIEHVKCRHALANGFRWIDPR
jgi:hypothetical protein